MELREQKGLQIAASGQIQPKDKAWLVPSQSGGKNYTVRFSPEAHSCTCPDYEDRPKKCKHIYAVERSLNPEPIEVPPAIKRPTYKQEWHEYNQAQTNEKARFQELLSELCAGIEEPEHKIGRPRLPLAEMIFAAVFKVYSTVSTRRFATDLREAQQRGYLSKAPHFNSICNYLELPSLTPMLKELIHQSSLPLRAIETDFAVDSSGFSTGQFTRWFDVKHKGKADFHDWVKLHMMCGVTTNIVTSVEITERNANDSPHLKPLLEATTANGFQVAELSADKGYDSFSNRCLVLMKGGQAYIPFREGEKNKPNPSEKGELWKRFYHFYKFQEAEFQADYHKRSNSETVFWMIKSKFGERLRSKTKTSQINEVLCKVLAHNICCLIQSIYELGIAPTFWKTDG
jgi:transposase